VIIKLTLVNTKRGNGKEEMKEYERNHRGHREQQLATVTARLKTKNDFVSPTHTTKTM
jgi:hypothetical protein